MFQRRPNRCEKPNWRTCEIRCEQSRVSPLNWLFGHISVVTLLILTWFRRLHSFLKIVYFRIVASDKLFNCWYMRITEQNWNFKPFRLCSCPSKISSNREPTECWVDAMRSKWQQSARREHRIGNEIAIFRWRHSIRFFAHITSHYALKLPNTKSIYAH